VKLVEVSESGNPIDRHVHQSYDFTNFPRDDKYEICSRAKAIQARWSKKMPLPSEASADWKAPTKVAQYLVGDYEITCDASMHDGRESRGIARTALTTSDIWSKWTGAILCKTKASIDIKASSSEVQSLAYCRRTECRGQRSGGSKNALH